MSHRNKQLNIVTAEACSLEFFFFVHLVSTFPVVEILHSPYRVITRRLFHCL